jgi:hypothetical protein
MSAMGRKVLHSPKKPSRAAVSYLAGDLDRQARLAVEGETKFCSSYLDPETVLCTRWAGLMETRHEEKPHGE